MSHVQHPDLVGHNLLDRLQTNTPGVQMVPQVGLDIGRLLNSAEVDSEASKAQHQFLFINIIL